MECNEKALNVVVTEATTDLALSLLYRIFCDDVFGADQELCVRLYDFPDKVAFLESTAIQITACAPNLLRDIVWTDDPSVAFRDADIILCLGVARGYDFDANEYDDPFFKQCVLVARHHGSEINKHAKATAKIIVLGNTEATIISRCLKYIPLKNVTALSIFNLKLATAHIASKVGNMPCAAKNVILWGGNSKHAFPDCRYLYFSDGEKVSDEIQVWLRNDLPSVIRNATNRSLCIRSLAYAIADHCKLLFNGTQEGEWTSMSVLSDKFYGVREGIFFSYPVYCNDGKYKIVQDLREDAYVMKRIKNISEALATEVEAALEICDLS